MPLTVDSVTMPSHFRLVVARPEHESAICVEYVVRMFARFAGWSVEFCALDDLPARVASSTAPPALLVYCPAADGPDLLASLGRTFRFAVICPASDFFGPSFMKSPDLPGTPDVLVRACTPQGFDGMLHHESALVTVLPFDLIAASFWLLTRYEEYCNTARDKHGRFPAGASAAPDDLYDQPAVNRWFEGLMAAFAIGLNFDTRGLRPGGRTTIALSHDVDRMRKYRPGPRGVGRAVKNLFNLPMGGGELKEGALVMAGSRRDPYDSFDELFSIKENLGAVSTFFFMSGGCSTYDCDYDLSDPAATQLLARTREGHDEIGLHPSYDCYCDARTLARETEALRAAAGKPVRGVRQHYLRFQVPGSWHAHSGAGFRYDSTLGFPDRAGFRCGWSGCFRPFDIETRTELPIIEIPLVAMDITLAVYEKLPAEKAVERLAALLEASHTRGGAFTLLWHNTLRDAHAYPGYWDTMSYFMSAAAGGSRFVTHNTLCNEFERPSVA